ncbi:putative tetraspanin-4 [Apostichopus japonicus]|uniref:Putative tetraspanin-4 n=1 Tax=Stichopus japonicus TaxID=307972 RepID=A0A2G8L455_STIJA|nr:putative tetraspanin-4 [Apostichopus japonicus]
MKYNTEDINYYRGITTVPPTQIFHVSVRHIPPGNDGWLSGIRISKSGGEVCYGGTDHTGITKIRPEREAGLTSAWDRMQTMLMCCGVDQSSDWHMFTPYYGQGQTPDSCCFSYNVGCGDNPSEEKWYMVSYAHARSDEYLKVIGIYSPPPPIAASFKLGCRESLIMEIEGNIDVITIVAICVALLEGN